MAASRIWAAITLLLLAACGHGPGQCHARHMTSWGSIEDAVEDGSRGTSRSLQETGALRIRLQSGIQITETLPLVHGVASDKPLWTARTSLTPVDWDNHNQSRWS
jgi:hypothetical protein